MAYVEGAGDIERKYDYWIDFGRRVERESLVKMLQDVECQGEDDWCDFIQQVVALIEGESK